MKLTTLGSYFFYIVLIVFALITNSYWSDFQNNDSYNVFRASFLLIGMCGGIISITLNYLKFNLPIGICLGWIVSMVLVYFANGSMLGDLTSMVLWPICFLSVYLLIFDNPELLKGMKFIFIIILFIGIYFFFIQWMNPQIVEGNEEQGRFNLVFFPLLTTPWILMLKNKWIKNLLFVTIFILVLLSQKRSAFIIMVVMLLPYVIYEVRSYQKKLVSIFIFGMLVAVFAASFAIYTEANDNNIVDRINNISEDEGSGRLPIYYAVITLQNHSSLIEWIFGHGHFAVRRDSPFFMSAHNDFLEVLYDYGIIVFGLYLLLWWYIAGKLIRMYKEKSKYFFAYFSSVVVFVFMSLVSHLVLYASNFIYLVCFWGAIEALECLKVQELETDK